MPSSKKKKREMKQFKLQEDDPLSANALSCPTMEVKREFTKFINELFTENRSPKCRLAAVEILSHKMLHLSMDQLSANAINWLGHLTKIYELDNFMESEKALICYTMAQLLILCQKSSELSRSISLNVVSKILTMATEASYEAEDVLLISLVNLVKITFKYFGGSCKSFKNKVELLLLNILLKRTFTSDDLVGVVVSCFAYLSHCGGQGPSGTTDLWGNRVDHLLYSISKLTTFIQAPCGMAATAVISQSPSPEGQPLPDVSGDVSPETIRDACKMLCVYVTLLDAILNTHTLCRVQLPCKRLLLLLCQLTTVSPDSVIFRRPSLELEALKYHLPEIHSKCMSLLATLVQRLGTNLMLYKTTISELLCSQLQWTVGFCKDSLKQSERQAYMAARSSVYDAVTCILSLPGCHTMMQHAADAVAQHTLKDLNFKNESQTSTYEPHIKRSKLAVTVKDTREEIVENPESKELVLKALCCLENLLTYCAVFLSSRWIKNAYDSLVTIAGRLQSDSDHYDSKYKQAFYKCLRCTLLCFNGETGPLTHIACSLIERGMTDPCPQVRSLCSSSQTLCLLATQPYAPAFEEHSSAYQSTVSSQGEEAEKESEIYELQQSSTFINPFIPSNLQDNCTVEPPGTSETPTITAEIEDDTTESVAVNIPEYNEEQLSTTPSAGIMDDSMESDEDAEQILPQSEPEDVMTSSADLAEEKDEPIASSALGSMNDADPMLSESVADMLKDFVADDPDDD